MSARFEGRLRRGLTLATLLGGVVVPSGRVYAQAADGNFSVQSFHPAPGPRNHLATRGLRSDGEMTYSAGLFVNYGNQPFVVSRCEPRDAGEPITSCSDANAETTDIRVVENVLTADVLASFTPIPPLQIGLTLPVTYVEGDGLTPEGTADFDDGINTVGGGDAALEVKYRAYGAVDAPLNLGGAAFATAPLGKWTADGNYVGDETPGVGLAGILDGLMGPLSFGANLAFAYRGESRVGQTELGMEGLYSAAVGYRASDKLRVMVDAFGTTQFNTDKGANAVEVDFGVQSSPWSLAFAFTAGVGAGLLRGIGAARVRGFLGVTYIGENFDADNDGLVDSLDQCPLIAEDKDGFQDTDGCPDKDNDDDLVLDEKDRCPNEAEDPDNFQDLDGCPEPDNDGDGLEDSRDYCPNTPETKNGYKDEDGCPDKKDTDNDGLPDDEDQCINEAEDTDGFQDTDGCPEPDNDGDGIPDETDYCPDQAETYNGEKDEDGCPEEGAAGDVIDLDALEPAPPAEDAAPAEPSE